MTDLVSATTTYGIGVFAMFFSQDMTTYVAAAGLVLVLVRIAGDIPKAILTWKELFKKDDEDGSIDE